MPAAEKPTKKWDPVEQAKLQQNGKPVATVGDAASGDSGLRETPQQAIDAVRNMPPVTAHQLREESDRLERNKIAKEMRDRGLIHGPPPDPPPAAPPGIKFRILEDKACISNGQHVVFKKGHIIDPVGHGGERGIAKLRAAGLELEEIKPPPEPPPAG